MLSNSPIVDVEVDGQTVTLALWDTCTAEEYERLRPLCYHGANAILLCFAIDSPDSLDSVTTKWVPEVLRYCAGVPLVLVGCKSDLRETSQRPVTWEEGMAVAQKIGAVKYLECSAKSGEGVREVLKNGACVALSSSLTTAGCLDGCSCVVF